MGTFLHCWWECKLVQPLWKTICRFLKKTKNRTTVWPSNSTPGDISKTKTKAKTLIQKDTHTPMFIAALFTIAKIWKQHECTSMDEWIKKMWSIYTQWNTTQP